MPSQYAAVDCLNFTPELLKQYRYPVDLKLKVIPPRLGGKQGGRAPDGHVRRCQAKSRRTQLQCAHWALRGALFCQTHGRRKRDKADAKYRMGGYYSKYAGPTLKAKMAELAEHAKDRHKLDEELDLARLLAQRTMKMFEAACIDPVKSLQSKPETKALAAQALKSSLDHVAELMVKSAKVQALTGAMIPAGEIDYIVAQIVKAIHNELGAKVPDLVPGLVKKIEAIALPQQKTAGVTISIT